MIFAKIKIDGLAQVNDNVRIDARKTVFRELDEVLDIEISPNVDTVEPGNSLPFISVLDERGDWFLDWSYDAAGTYNATVRVKVQEADESDPGNIIPAVYKSASKEIVILTEAQDALFSSDDDIVQSEPDIYRYLPEGRTSFTFMHREAQRRILAFLDEQRIWKQDGTRYAKDDLFDKEEFVHWSRFMVLELIFMAKIVSSDDFFAVKSTDYAILKKQASNRATLRLSEDGVKEPEKKYDKSITMVIKR